MIRALGSVGSIDSSESISRLLAERRNEFAERLMVPRASASYADVIPLTQCCPRERIVMLRSLLTTLCVGLSAMNPNSLEATEPTRAEQVPLAVRFKLTNLEYQLIAGAEVRLVVCLTGPWQTSRAGERFVTGANGEHRFETITMLEARSRKRPTNFMDSLLSRPQPTDFLSLGAELEYAGHRWLYVVELHRFRRDGDMLLEGVAVYCADARGDFTRRATFKDGNWMMADLGGLALSTPGHEAWEFTLKPDESDATKQRWMLDLAFKRWPNPVRR